MNKTAIEQYREKLSSLERVDISTSWDKLEKYMRLAKIIYQIFTLEVWKEWDTTFPLIAWFKNGELSLWIPIWLEELEDSRKVIPRLSTFQILALERFWSFIIEKFISENQENTLDCTIKEYENIIWWFTNACETGRHMFWNFKVHIGRDNPTPTNLVTSKIRTSIISSSMLDINTFNQQSPRNYYLESDGRISHHTEFIAKSAMERVWCIATRRFPWITPEKTLFDELFSRICQIYGYNHTNTLQESTSERVSTICPFHNI